MFENVDNIHTYIHTYVHYKRTTEAYLYYKLTNEPKGSGELKYMSFPFCSNKRLLCIIFFFTTKLVRIKCIQNIQFSISIRRSP